MTTCWWISWRNECRKTRLLLVFFQLAKERKKRLQTSLFSPELWHPPDFSDSMFSNYILISLKPAFINFISINSCLHQRSHPLGRMFMNVYIYQLLTSSTPISVRSYLLNLHLHRLLSSSGHIQFTIYMYSYVSHVIEIRQERRNLNKD